MNTVETTVPTVARKENVNQRAYRLLNAVWPREMPEMTDRDAKFAARVLYRHIMGDKFKGKLIIKHQGRSWMRPWKIIANPRRGWSDVIHDWSHDLHKRKWPSEKPHGPHQAPIERSMAEECVKRGWLSGRLNKPETPKPKRNVKDERYQAVLKRIKLWEAKEKRATIALKKLYKQKKYYERSK